MANNLLKLPSEGSILSCFDFSSLFCVGCWKEQEGRGGLLGGRKHAGGTPFVEARCTVASNKKHCFFEGQRSSDSGFHSSVEI